MKFVKNGGNGTQAALDVYNTSNPNTAAVIASKNIRLDKVKESVEQILNRRGLDLESITAPVSNILHSEPEKVTGDNVLRAADMLYRLHNAYPASKSAHISHNIADKYENMKYEEILFELKEIRKTSAKLLEDLEN